MYFNLVISIEVQSRTKAKLLIDLGKKIMHQKAIKISLDSIITNYLIDRESITYV